MSQKKKLYAPRVVMAGTGSGCGKTTVTCAVLQALTDRGIKVAAFKYGPDYIDPMFHSRIIGAESGNLDSFFFSENTLRYEDSLGVLTEMGAELIAFSLLGDTSLPENIHGLYLGGGYPELYAESLSRNTEMRAAVKQTLAAGLPCIAECGGFMYLTQAIGGWPMAGYLPGSCFDAGHLVRFGYVTLTAKEDNLLCRAGDSIRGHEFHRWEAEHTGKGFTAEKSTGRRDCVHATDRLYAGFPHFHFYANPVFSLSATLPRP